MNTPTAPLHPWVAGYLAPYTGRTRENYTGYLGRWERWLTDRGITLEHAQRQDIEAWRAHLAGQGVRDRGVRTALGPVRGLYRWAVESGLLDRDPAYLVRMPHTTRRSQRAWLDRTQLRTLLTHVDAHADPAMRAAVHLWGLCGLRPAEPRQLRISDIGRYEDRMSIGLSHRKAGGADRITVSPPVEAAVTAAIGGRGRGPLMLNPRTGQVMGKGTVQNRFARLVDGAGVPHVTPYGLRAGFITLSLIAGVDEREVMYAAGHASSAQTAYYDRARHTIESHAVHKLTEWITTDA